MSLVNKMLRDLDARHVGAAERGALPAAVTPLARHEQPIRLAPTLLNIGLLALALGGAFAWFQLQVPRTSSGAAGLGGAEPPVAPARNMPPVAVAEPVPPAAATPQVQALPAPAEQRDTKDTSALLSELRLADELARVPVEAARPKPPSPKIGAEARREAVPAPRREAAAPPAPVSVAAQSVPPAPVSAVEPEARVEKVERQPTPAERAEQAYRRGIAAQRQGNTDAAVAGLRMALDEQPGHAGARQALAALLIEQRRFDDAEDVLRKGIDHPASGLASALALARLKVERQQVPAALEVLQRNAALGERSADYQGFAGALLNRLGRGAEAVERYRAATRLAPSEGRWWAGLGISLEGSGHPAEAREAYLKARSLPGLPADLAHHVDQRLR